MFHLKITLKMPVERKLTGRRPNRDFGRRFNSLKINAKFSIRATNASFEKRWTWLNVDFAYQRIMTSELATTAEYLSVYLSVGQGWAWTVQKFANSSFVHEQLNFWTNEQSFFSTEWTNEQVNSCSFWVENFWTFEQLLTKSFRTFEQTNTYLF